MQNEIATKPRDVEHRRRVTTVKQPSPPPFSGSNRAYSARTDMYTTPVRIQVVRETKLIIPTNVL